MKFTAALSARAISHGILITHCTRKTKLIREIQKKEGQTSCFRTDLRVGCNHACEWSDQCKDFLIASWRR